MANSKVIGIGVGVLLLGAAATVGLTRGCSPTADHHDPLTLADAGQDGANDAGDAQGSMVNMPTNTSPESTRVGCIGNDCPHVGQIVPQPDPSRPPTMGGGATSPDNPMNVAPDPHAPQDAMVAPEIPGSSPSATAPRPGVSNPPQAEQTRVGCIGPDCPQGDRPGPRPDPTRRP